MDITKEQAESLNEEILITDYLSELSFDVTENMTIEKVEEELNILIDEHEIIGYSPAIEFLSNEDASLTESLELASEYGFEIIGLNSEILATLLMQDRMRDDLSKSILKIFK